MKTQRSFGWLAFAALCACLLAPASFAQVLQNGVWANANAGAPQIPTFQVPAGQASLRFEVQDVRAYDIVNNLPGISSLILATSIGSNPDRDLAQYRATYGAGSSGSLTIANPPPGLYWFRLFPTAFSLRYLGAYQVRATYYPPPPTITSQPQAQTVKAGASASFSVAATSSAALSYQWQKNGANIGGATGSTYTISNAQPTDEANYGCVVSNSGGSVTSSAAKLTVLVPPTITSQPKSVAVMPANNATFEVAATGTTPLTYAWMKNGSPVSGATANTFTIGNVTFPDAASYTVEVRNSAGSVTSAAALLTVGPAITVQPQSVTVSAGGSATFGVTATGSAPLSYQWYRNGSAVGGQVNTTFSLSNVQSADTGSVYVKVSNAAGSVQSSTVTLAVTATPPPPPPDVKPTITAQPLSLTATEGGTVTLTVVATGTAQLTYQWYFTPSAGVGVQSLGATGAKAVAGGTSATLQISPVTAAQAGDYYAVISNGVGSVTSATARLTADPKPQVVTQPQSREVPPGTNVTFTVTAIGRAPLSYQWYRDDQLIPGATQSSLTLTNVTEADSGKSISVVVSNGSGSVRTQIALLTVSAAFADVGTLLWSSDTPSQNPPAFGPDGNLYLGTFIPASAIAALTPLGKIQWSFPNGVVSSIGRDGTIYSMTAPSIVAVRQDKGLLWTFRGGIGSEFQQTAIRGDGRVVAASGSTSGVYFPVLDSSAVAEVATSFRDGGSASSGLWVVVGEDDTEFLSHTGYIVALNPDGSRYWNIRYGFASKRGVLNSPGSLIVLTFQTTQSPGVLWWVSPSGIVSRKADVPFAYDSGGARCEYVIGRNDEVVLSGPKTVRAYNSDASLLWTTTISDVTGNEQSYSPAIAADGTVYVTARFSLYAFNAQGGLKWQYATRETVWSAPTIGPDGTVYFSTFSTTNKKLYAIKGSAPMAASSWPVEGGNPRRTFRGTRAPAFTATPKPSSVEAGQTATFTAAATGTPPLWFQWRFRGANLIGATNATLTLSSVTVDKAGLYEVEVMNPDTGLLIRTNAQLSVSVPQPIPPKIISQPISIGQSVPPAGTVFFRVEATGTAPLRYQWQKDGVNLPGATDTTLTISSVQANDAGTYTVIVSNAAGSVTSQSAILTVTGTGPDPVAGDRVVRLDNTTGSAGSTVTIPITFVAKGDENSISFSLTFPSNQTSFGGVTLGSGATGASLVVNPNQAAGTPAKVGVVISWPVDRTIASGTQPLATLTLQIAAGLPVGTVIPVQFTNSPALKSASDTLGNDVAMAFTDGSITVGAAGYEGDVAPRPNGNGVINAGDLTVLGRIVAGLDNAPTGAELQRADCAPRSSLGNGIINAGDLTQLARYVAGLDPQSPVGGPIAPAAGTAGLSSGSSAVARKSVGARRFTIGDGSMAAGSTGVVTVKMIALGDENALSFSLSFDPARMTYRSAALGAGATGANLLLNTNLVPVGKLGVVISLPAGQVAAAGTLDLLNVTFQAGSTPGTVALAFGNSPAPKSISEALGNDLTATFTDGSVTIQGSGQAPVITSSPQSQTAGVGSSVTLSASATGTAPLAYQWQKNGVPIANAITATLTLSNFQTADAASYTVVVSNAYGSVTSQAGFVTLTPVVVSTRRLTVGNATLNAGATGLATVQMTAQGNENALSFSLSFDPARLTYRSAAVGAATAGANLLLNTNLAPTGKLGVVISLPAGQVAAAGTLDLLNVTFQAGSTPGTVALAFGNSPAPQSVSDLLGNDLSCPFVDGTMTIVGSVQVPVITTQPQSQTLPSGSTATFTVGVAGSGPWTYQWYRGDLTLTDGQDVTGARGATLTLQNLKPSDSALFKVVVTGTGGSAEASARLTVTEPSSPVPGLVIPRFYTGASALYSQLRAAIPGDFGETQIQCDRMNNQGEIIGAVGGYGYFAKLRSGIVLLSDVYKRDLGGDRAPTSGIESLQAINENGDIVGTLLADVSPSHENRAFLFRNGRMTDLGVPIGASFANYFTLGQGSVLQINNSDQVLVGNDYYSRRSWIKDLKTGQWILLTPDGSDWAARGLNDLGEVVGQFTKSKKGAIWSGGVLREIPNNPGTSTLFDSPLYISNDGRIIWTSGHITDREGKVQQTLRPHEHFGVFASRFKITGQNIVMYPPGDSNLSLWKGADYVTYDGSLGQNNPTFFSGFSRSSSALRFSDIDDSGRLLHWSGIATPSVPLILNQPQTVRVREGATASLSVTVAGALPTTRGDGILGAWHHGTAQPDGKVSLGSSDLVTWTNRLQIPTVRTQHAGDYYFVATNVSGVVTSAVARIEVISPPRITRQPEDVTASASSTVQFSVEATGVPPPVYQWRHDGKDLPGETGASLTLANVALNSAGTYSVVVQNSEGSLTSRSALLTVKSLPSRRILVSQAPGDAPGSLTAVIQATAQGNENALSFSLAFDPARLTYVSAALGSGATGANFIANVNQAQSGQLGVVISLPAGQSLSVGSLDLLQVRFTPIGTPGKVPITFAKTPAPISISDVLGNDLVCEFVDGSVTIQGSGQAPVITSSPQSQTAAVGSTVNLSASATGTAPLIYQWQKNGVPIANASAATLTLSNFQSADVGSYTVVVSNAYGSATSQTAVLSTAPVPPPGDFGTVQLNNRIVGVLEVRVVLTDGTGAGAGWKAQLYGGPEGGSESALLPTTTFRITNAAAQGYLNPVDVTVPGVAPNGRATLVLRVYLGESFETSSQKLESNPFTVVLGGGILPPAVLVGLKSFSYVLDRLPTPVERELPKFYSPGSKLTVALKAAPAASTSVYAVEEAPPSGWTVGTISDNGVYDGINQKIKWGPFFDASSRRLTYEVTPRSGETGTKQFSGLGSFDSQSFPVAGATTIELGVWHPADRDPADGRMTISESTAYGQAWKTGVEWPIAPNPIPIEYVTRAGSLWKNGEVYVMDPSVGSGPVWWVNRPTGNVGVQSLRSVGLAGNSAEARRTLNPVFVPGEASLVGISVRPPSSVSAYALQDQVPPGWSAANISDGGHWDEVSRQVKWGPFFDNRARDFSYEAQASAQGAEAVVFAGISSFDGDNAPVSGPSQSQAAARLDGLKRGPGGQYQMRVTGRAGTRWVIQVSSDLRQWETLATALNENGVLRFSDSKPQTTGLGQQRFYRIVTP